MAVVHGAVREFRRSDGGSARQGAGRHLRKTKTDVDGEAVDRRPARSKKCRRPCCASGDVVVCDAGDLIPGDGEVIDGIATVDESVITGESAPVIRESGGDRSAVTGGTRVLSDQIKIRITSNPGETFLDRMIALVEGAERQKTPNEIALNILIAGLDADLPAGGDHAAALRGITAWRQAGSGAVPTCRGAGFAAGLPDSDDHRRAAFRHRHRRHGSRDAAQRAGHERQGGGSGRRRQSLLLDKTGTITLGNRQAVEFLPVDGVTDEELADAAQLSSLADETPEGRSVVVLAKEKYGLRGRHIPEHEATFIPFSAYTRMSGVDFEGRQLRKGATDAIVKFVHGARRRGSRRISRR